MQQHIFLVVKEARVNGPPLLDINFFHLPAAEIVAFKTCEFFESQAAALLSRGPGCKNPGIPGPSMLLQPQQFRGWIEMK